MRSQPIFSSALLLAVAQAGVIVVPRAGPDMCPATIIDEEGRNATYAANVRYFADGDCTVQLTHDCFYTVVQSDPPGSYVCGATTAPNKTPYYAQVEDSPFPSIQILYTQDQSCPPSGPGAVFATLIDGNSCVEMNKAAPGIGVSIYPQGGAGIAKRDNPSCSGFTIDSQQTSESQSVQVSNIIDCTNGASGGCMITESEEHTTSVSTMYSATAGGGIEGVFDVMATFGMDFTDSSSTSVQQGFSIQAGQKGYLSAYSAAVLFKGTFTGCSSGDANQPGQALVIRNNAFTYTVVNTGS
ncbi:hypothetical protein PRZ48_006319 [Zasmidium cellare]|uniref:Uncharacterized protein n=1 Tax=Zasmidium cellare TaxID=395010 RepID=A0ABR0ENX8_ZASCE|nr:hypothetical protein PRZ48_006319 [Zasmidium cellare]